MKSAKPALAIEPEILRGAAAQAVGAMKILANEQRLLLLCQIAKGEHCVTDLEQQLDIRQPTLSQQLGVLRRDGVVDAHRRGKNMFYSIRDRRMLEVLETLYRVYCPAGKTKGKT